MAEPAGDAIRCAAPARPRALDCALMVLVVPLPCCAMGLPGAAQGVGEEAARILSLPAWTADAFGVGGVLAFVALLGLLLHAHATRYRAAHIDDHGIILGSLEPTPRGIWLRWRDLTGFRVGSGRIVLAVRRQPWTRWLGPIVACDDEVLHRVVVLLESKGIRRLDG